MRTITETNMKIFKTEKQIKHENRIIFVKTEKHQ